MLKLVLLPIILIACWRANITTSVLELSNVEELTQRYQALNDEYKATVQRDLNLQKIVKAIQEQAHFFNENAQYFVKKLKEEGNGHQADVDNVVRKLQQKLKDTVEGIGKIFMYEIATDTQKWWKEVAKIERLSEDFELDLQKLQSIVQKISESGLDHIVTIGKTFETNVKEAVGDHES